ncbi:MAG TPA: hypothetical protein VLA19_27440 [Herpetosiphonaceae bacterium]|nr:hypothetical protein [Herpetosiphonaceae bacterium]
MHVAHPHWRSYRIPLRGDFCTGRGVVAAREGAIVMIEADDGRIGQGDVAPLPALGETPREALDLLQVIGPALFGRVVGELTETLVVMTTPGR